MNIIKRKLLILALLMNQKVCVLSNDYCEIEEKKCKSEPHIGCNKTGITFQINPECMKIKAVNLKTRTKNYIIHLHNSLRDKLAGGNIKKYPSASRMLEMYWDKELEATACLHVKYCMMEHDKCRATSSFDYPGQNLALAKYTNYPQSNITKEWYNGITAWFDEYEDVNANIIEKFVKRKPHEKQYGHFTVMSKDNNDRIGCCHITFQTEEPSNLIWYGHLLTCNYRETNIIGSKTYIEGSPKSKCKDFGEKYIDSKTYKYLCTSPKDNDKLTLKNKDVETEKLPKDFCEIAEIKCGRHKHIACETDSGFSVNPSCKNIKVHDISTIDKTDLLKKINSYRDLVAGGNHKNFPSAAKMMEMKWDSSLEKIACSHVQYCQMKHADCRATESDSYFGQSLFGYSSSINNKNNHSLILNSALETWFNQSFKNPFSIFDDQNIDFGLMMKEDQNKFGCCFITYEIFENKINWYSHLITCLYENLITKYSSIYTKGKPVSECRDIGYATSVSYENLCINENSANTFHLCILVKFSTLLFLLYFYNKIQ